MKAFIILIIVELDIERGGNDREMLSSLTIKHSLESFGIVTAESLLRKLA